MSSQTIQLTFPASPQVGNNDTIQLTATDGVNTVTFDLIFRTSLIGDGIEVLIPTTYSNIAFEFKNTWTGAYQTGNEFTSSVDGNVVTIFTNNEYEWNSPTGQTITDGSITFSIGGSSNTVTLTNYAPSVGNECTQFEVDLDVTGGTSPYDVYVNNVLESSSITLPTTLTLERSVFKNIKVIDSLGSLIGISSTDNTTPITANDITIEVVEENGQFNATVNAKFISNTVSPYTYSIDGVNYQVNATFNNISSGSTTFYVKDALGCVTSRTYSVGFGLIYYLEFTDLEGILHRVNISKLYYAGSATEVNGRCYLEYPENDDLQSPIKASNLRITLEADSTLTFADLYTEEERIFKVDYIRDSVTLFNGFLNPEGLFESYVDDRWLLELNAIDGLGYLKDLAYVDNTTGLRFNGKQKISKIIANCLIRTGIIQEITIDIKIGYKIYENLGFTSSYVAAFCNSERFVNDSDKEVLDCESVLKNVLGVVNASIISYKGKWYIYRANQLFDSTTFTGDNYDSNGNLQTTEILGFPVAENTIVDISQNLGSQIDGFYPHHANANQQKTIKRSLGAYRVALNYGRLLPFYPNTELVWDNATTINDWTINQPDFVIPAFDLKGFSITNSSNSNPILTSDTYTIPSTGFIKTIPKLDLKFNLTNPNQADSATFKAIVKIDDGTGTQVRYLNQTNGVWNTLSSFVELELDPGATDVQLKIVTESTIYADAQFTVELYNDTNNYIVDEIYITAFRGEGDPTGTNVTITKTVNVTPNIDDNTLEVLIGDVPSNSFESAIYKSDLISQTKNWTRTTEFESKPLLRIHAEDRIRMNYSPRLIFKGDIYGYLPFFSVLNINNVNSKMLPYAYSYDCYNNVITLSSMELLNNEINPSDVNNTSSDVFKNTVERPIISGRPIYTPTEAPTEAPSNAFIFTVDTTQPGTASNQFQLPLSDIGTPNYNFTVNWGDGSSDVITNWNQAETLHTYSIGGTYQISIEGTLEKWYFNNSGDKLKLISVDNWGDIGLTGNGLYAGFWGCSNALSYALDIPNYDVTTLTGCWSNNSSCTQFPNVNNLTSVSSLFITWSNCSSATSFPSVSNLTSVGNLISTWSGCSSATSFPDVSSLINVTSLSGTWSNCSSATSFPSVSNLTSVTNLSSTWFGCTSATSFPSVSSLINVTSLSNTWANCTNTTSFPDVSNLINVTNLQFTWNDCYSATSFPDVSNLINVTNLQFTWNGCSSLSNFNLNQFNNFIASDYTNAFQNTILSQTSIDNILVSIDTSGVSNGVFGQSGGSAPSVATGQPAIDSLRAKGWTITVTGGY